MTDFSRRSALEKIGGLAVGTSVLGSGLTAVSGVTAAAGNCDGSGDCKTIYTVNNARSAYDKLNNREATIYDPLSIGISRAQAAPKGDWRYYVCAHFPATAWYDDNSLAPLLGKQKIEVAWLEEDHTHVEYPDEYYDDWVAYQDPQSYSDYDLPRAGAEFAWSTGNFIYNFVSDEVPDPVDPILNVANYVQGLSSVAENLGGWFDSWDSVSYEYEDIYGLHSSCSFVLFELDRISPGETITFSVEGWTNQRREFHRDFSLNDSRKIEHTVTAPDYDSPSVT